MTDQDGGLLEQARNHLSPSPEGQPALSQQLAQALASYGSNLVKNGSFESWSAGTTSAPDGWTLSGAGATIARNTTSGQIQEGLASCNVTAALNTVTRLSQTITISATQNTRLRSRQVVLSAQVLVSTAARISMELDDGVLVTTSPIQHTGSGAFETLTVTITVDSAATQIKASLLISSGASITATMDAAKLEEGATATAFNPNPNDAFVQPRVVSLSASTTTTSTTAVDIGTGFEIANVILDGSQSVLLTVTILNQNNTVAAANAFAMVRTTTTIGQTFSTLAHTADQDRTFSEIFLDSKPAAGNYTYKVQWSVTAGSTGTITGRVLGLAVIPTA